MAIATQDIAVTETPANLTTATDPDLVVGDTVFIENTSAQGVIVRIAELAAAPTGDNLNQNLHSITPGDEGYVSTIQLGFQPYVWVVGDDGQITVSNG